MSDFFPFPEREAWKRLEQGLHLTARKGHFALAYSGGLDSRFLAHASQRLGLVPELLHVVGPHVSPDETAYARSWAIARKLSYMEVEADPLALPLVASGDRERCYACKRELFSLLRRQTDLPLCDGTNASDAGHYRPGTRAVRELCVRSPLADAGLTKMMIHHLAASTGMEDPDQKPHPCLLTRLPYGMKPERRLLQLLADGEKAMRILLEDIGSQDPDFRLRFVDDRLELHVVSEIEALLSPELRERILHHLVLLAPELPSPCIRGIEKLSGFFDREQST